MNIVWAGTLALIGVSLAGGEPATGKAATLETMRAEIEALKPANHVWRAIAWRTCPLEALKSARQEKKPIITWVFLGVPTDERC
jgi:hypothetical protein